VCLWPGLRAPTATTAPTTPSLSRAEDTVTNASPLLVSQQTEHGVDQGVAGQQFEIVVIGARHE
jgi:hypothetical protein